MANPAHNERYVTVEDDRIGLDRANVRPHDQIELPRDNESQPGLPTVDTTDGDFSKRHRLREKRDHAKDRLKKVMHIGHGNDNVVDGDAPVLAPSVHDKSNSRLVQGLPKHEKTTMQDGVHNPIDTIKEKVSGHGSHQAAVNIAAKEISHGEEVDLVRAHDRLMDARSDTERLQAVQDVDALLKERQNAFVRWSMDRHVTKLRKLPKSSFPRKTAADFERMDPIEGRVMDWRGYLTYVRLQCMRLTNSY